MKRSELLASLSNFRGSVSTYRLNKLVVLSEGVVYLCTHAKAFWLAEAISSYLTQPHVRSESFQLWKLNTLCPGSAAVLSMTDGNGSKPIVVQNIPYTDFILDEIKLYVVANGDGPDWVMMLPGEY